MFLFLFRNICHWLFSPFPDHFRPFSRTLVPLQTKKSSRKLFLSCVVLSNLRNRSVKLQNVLGLLSDFNFWTAYICIKKNPNCLTQLIMCKHKRARHPNSRHLKAISCVCQVFRQPPPHLKKLQLPALLFDCLLCLVFGDCGLLLLTYSEKNTSKKRKCARDIFYLIVNSLLAVESLFREIESLQNIHNKRHSSPRSGKRFHCLAKNRFLRSHKHHLHADRTKAKSVCLVCSSCCGPIWRRGRNKRKQKELFGTKAFTETLKDKFSGSHKSTTVVSRWITNLIYTNSDSVYNAQWMLTNCQKM